MWKLQSAKLNTKPNLHTKDTGSAIKIGNNAILSELDGLNPISKEKYKIERLDNNQLSFVKLFFF